MIKAKHIIKSSALLLTTAAYLFLTANCKTKDLSSYKYANANVILIIIDTLRADHLGCYGYHRNTSPEIDKIANEGILFKNMLAQTSWTRPGTASILSGLYPKNHGANTRKDRLAEEINLLPEILGRVGYTSYAFVANGNAGERVGFNQGYKDFFSYRESVKKDKSNIHVRSDEINETVLNVIRQLEERSKNFIYVHYVDPHAPYIPKEKHFSKADKTVFSMEFRHSQAIFKMSEEKKHRVLKEMINAYDDEILFNDKMIGNLIRALKKKNMYHNSIIIITSDHGEEFLEHNNIGHGRTLYDDQLRVPLIIRLPDNVHKKTGKIANQIDVCPTILSLLKIPIPKNIDGKDLFDKTTGARQFNCAELCLGKNILFSVQTTKDKLIEKFPLTVTEKGRFRWFRESALIETGEDSLELIIGSLQKKCSIQLNVSGKPIKEMTITPGKHTFDIVLPESNIKKTVTIRSLTSCQMPADLGIGNDRRCLAFRIFNSKNIDINTISEIYNEYFALKNDPGEKTNRYHRKQFKKLIMELKKKLSRYKSEKRNLRLNKKPVIFDEEQLKALEALGYL
jgi:hypothetical protein